MAKVQLDAVLKLVDVQINPQVFRKISQAVAGLPPALAQTNTNLKKIGGTAQGVNKRLQKTGQQLNTNERAARLFLQRMAQFAILLPTFATLNRAIQGSVSFLFEFDSALRDIVRVDVGGLSNRMEEIGDAALKTAADFGVTATEVLNTIRVFKQAGDTIEESQERARVAILATQISTLNAAQATEVFIAAARQFGEVGQDSAAVLDKLAKVEDIAAVNAADVADAFRTGGNALAEFSQSIDDSIGLIAALREQTRKSGREVGTFFKTLQTRLFAAGEARDAVEALGVEVENLDGSLRPTLAVLNDLKMRFDGLTQAQQTNAAKSIAGIRQFESLIGTLNSLEKANEFAEESANAAGTAEEKRLITDAKLERQLGKLIAQGQLLAEALGDAGLEDSLAGVLKVATSILKAFTSLGEIIDSIGGNITPLLALGGVTLGRSVFGLSRQGAPGGGGPGAGGPTAGQAGFIGPLTQAQDAMTKSFKENTAKLKTSFGQVFRSSVGLAGSLVPTTGAIKQQGVVLGVNINNVKQHTAALKAATNAARASAGAATQKGLAPLQGGAGTLLLTLIGTALPAALTSAAKGLRTFDNGVAQTGADILDVSKGGLGLAAQFAVLGPQAAAVAGAFGIVQSSILTIIDAVNEEIDARKEIAAAQKEEAARIKGGGRLTGRTEQSLDLQEALLRSLQSGVAGKRIGKELAAGIEEGFTSFGRTTEAQEAMLTTNERVREGLLKNIDTFKTFIGNNEDLIKSMTDSAEQTAAFEELQQMLANGTNADLGPAFNRLLVTLGATVPEINEFTGALEEARKDFATFQKVLKVQAFADSIRTLGLELELAQLGPEALADSVVRMQNELLVAERESGNTVSRMEEELAGLFTRLDEFTVGLNPAGLSAAEFFNKVNNGVKTLDPEKIAEFEDFIEQLPKAQRKAANEIMSILEKQLGEEIKIQNQRNELQAETNRRQKDLLNAEAAAAQNAFESTRRFTAELQQFGDMVTTDVLAAFQGVSLGDVEDVLGGTSELSDGLQQLILGSFADPVAKAELALKAATESTTAEMDILASRLDLVNEKLADEANAAQFAALTTEKLGLELEMEKQAQTSAIEETKLKIKVLEAEQEAEKDAAEAAKKRAELLEKLADASRDFENELKNVERAFEDFQKDKIADLLGQEADARSELKEAQQEVLSTTQELAEAYDSLIKAQLEFNGAIAEARIKSAMLARDIGMLTGEIVTFDQGLASIGNAFRGVLDDANITLQKRIDLERQLAEETLSFLQQARDEIVNAGLGIFGQTGAENQALGQGIAGLQFVADQLGGSFESFLSLTQGELSSVTETLLGLPSEFRQQILDALSFLPSTMNIGGFSVDQLQQAIGQVGAGVDPEAGLPSIEELNNQQVEQLTKLQELALQDAQLQFAQVIAAQEQLAAAEEAAEAAKLLEERASENLAEVRDAVLEEKAVLDLANEERRELLAAVVAADDKNTLMQIEKEAQLFSEQNATFREVGDIIVQGISSAIGGKLAVLEAAANVGGAAKGFLPNFAGGNLTPGEAAGLLRAGAREKRAMPGGAGLAVANTSEAIIPMRNGGFIPNFQEGNSDISAGISAIKSINETVVAAIARSVTAALTDLQTGGGSTEELLQEVISQLGSLNDSNDDIVASNTTVAANTADTGTGTGGATQTSPTQRVEITLQTNQNNSVSVTGLESLRDELESAVMTTTADQVDEQVSALFEQLDEVITALQERGILSSFGQTR
ncbi:MAG: phage tail tape measure protein [Hydrogenophaga sp.]|uniref:phage tail tape measure protein n=1 Tax=Hydrogenophaga sp. TaxID=1904254 RepID=UPI0026047D44|nr:phage tail tape measure protein [Hydrogenophaga sp.]MCV0439741.1 phage tail tape measure protein [Hydrogenophaga sp.]